jgi:hypothetical protein
MDGSFNSSSSPLKFDKNDFASGGSISKDMIREKLIKILMLIIVIVMLVLYGVQQIPLEKYLPQNASGNTTEVQDSLAVDSVNVESDTTGVIPATDSVNNSQN